MPELDFECKSALLLIYENRLQKHFDAIISSCDLDLFRDFLGSVKIAELRKKSVNKVESRQIFQAELMQCRHKGAFSALLQCIIDSGSDRDLVDRLLCTKVPDLENYRKILHHYSEICDTLQSEVLAHFLGKIVELGHKSKEDVEFIQLFAENPLSEFLQSFPYEHDDWYWRFMSTLESVGGAGSELRGKIDPNYDWNRRAHAIDQLIDPNVSMFPVDVPLDPEDPSFCASNSGESVNPVEAISLRNYQKELVEWAVRGENCVICAPTGAGKTVVAAFIIQKTLEKNPNAKIALFVPTVALVDQQLTRFVQKYISAPAVGLKGGGIEPKKQLMLDNSIVVMTPAIFLNEISAKPVERATQVRLVDFDLLIFDECHHCDKQHPYSSIMAHYGNLLNRDKMDPKRLPQIVGVTASLANGEAKNEVDARDFILDICARLNAKRLVTVQKYKEELAQYVPAPIDHTEAVESVHVNHLFSKHVCDLMNEIEQKLTPYLSKLPRVPPFDICQKMPRNRFEQPYESYLCQSMEAVKLHQDQSLKHVILRYLQYLKVLYTALFLHAHLPATYPMQYIQTKMEYFHEMDVSAAKEPVWKAYAARLAQLRDTAENGLHRMPIVEKLKEILLAEYAKNESAKTIVFVKTRVLTSALCAYMQKDPDLGRLKPQRLVGRNVSKVEQGQTDRQQDDALTIFRSEESKVLVATTVAEEGLDVPSCNLVIKYNNVSNATALIQRRGRGRAENSRSILLAHDAKVLKQERMNALREELMKKAIEFLTKKFDENEQWFRVEIQTRQQKEQKLRDQEEALYLKRKKDFACKTYDILCSQCSAVICASDRIKLIQNAHYVTTDPNSWKQMKLQTEYIQRMCEESVFLGQANCLKCNKSVGVLMRYEKVYFVAISAKDITLREKFGQARLFSCKQWKKIQEKYFLTEAIEYVDKRNMAESYRQNNIGERFAKADKMIEERRMEIDKVEASKADVSMEDEADLMDFT